VDGEGVGLTLRGVETSQIYVFVDEGGLAGTTGADHKGEEALIFVGEIDAGHGLFRHVGGGGEGEDITTAPHFKDGGSIVNDEIGGTTHFRNDLVEDFFLDYVVGAEVVMLPHSQTVIRIFR